MTRRPRQRLRLALLRAFTRLAPAPDPHRPPSAPQAARILVIRPDHLGDLLFTTPALRALRQRYRDAQITALVGPWGEAVLSNNPHVDQVITLAFPGFTRRPKSSPWQPYGLLRRWARGLRRQYDLAFILRFDHWWGALLAYLAGVPHRVGYAVPEVAPFLSHALPYDAERHEVQQNLRLIASRFSGSETAAVGPTPNSPDADSLAMARYAGVYLPGASYNDGRISPLGHPLEFHIPEQANTWARDLLQTDRSIAIHPGAGAAVKLWQPERWATVADALASETGAPIVLTGSKAELSLCAEIAGRMEQPSRVVAGQTTLDQLAALFAQCQLVLGLDSGPLHLAVAVGTPTIHLYGPVAQATFGPWGAPSRHRVLTSGWPCIPCNRLDYDPCELASHPCVREISANRVLSAARGALSSG